MLNSANSRAGRKSLSLAFAVLLLAPVVFAQISPGELSRAHRDLSGSLSCGKCHSFGKGRSELKCLECHEEIALGMTEKRGYHVRKVAPASASNDCARCHSEHNGKDHRLVRWPATKEQFNHNEAGWNLEGKHAQVKCAQCHNEKNIEPRVRAVLKRRDLNTTFTGQRTDCLACHKDTHAGQLNNDCTKCHTLETWKTAPGFSHEKTVYPLTGLHAKLECAKCHRPRRSDPSGPVLYKNFTFFQNCAACHQDPHGGAFAGTCQSCHTVAGWKLLNAAKVFDHSKTKFPLAGKHTPLPCKTCHKTENFSTPIPFARCLDCHRDQHAGQFAKRADGGDCKACHDELSWKKSRFSASDHANTAYPLQAKHAAVTCGRCHVPKGKDTQYKIAFAACSDCHRDAHAGQFAALPYKNQCDACHTLLGFQPSTYTLAAHKKTRFNLRGAHVAVPCSACHTPKKENTQFHPAGEKCTDCHTSPHGNLSSGLSCENCHTLSSWKERGEFDHGRTKFQLLGRHRTVDCLACHKPSVSGTIRKIVFPGTPADCAACHADVHDGQFKAAGAESQCLKCHTAVNWNPTEFDHLVHSTFHLGGSHERVPCRMCHEQTRLVAGRKTIAYKGTSRECSVCHR